MTSYRYLGYGVTDSNGVAHLKYDAEGHEITPQGYHGTGAGEVDVIASLDNPINSSSIVSGTYPVTDCIFYDDGVTGNLPSDWKTGVITSSRDGTGTYWKNEQSAWKNVYLNKSGTDGSFYDWGSNLCFEFTVVSIGVSSNMITLQFKDENNVGLSKALTDMNISPNDVITVEDNGTNIIIKKNGVAQGNPSTASNNKTIMFSFAPNGEIKIKDFKLYPI